MTNHLVIITGKILVLKSVFLTVIKGCIYYQAQL